ncbi:unnamed protein product, partial [Ectocarpus fasciculatus]
RRRAGGVPNSVPVDALGELGRAAGLGEGHQGGQDRGNPGPRVPHPGGDGLPLWYRQGIHAGSQPLARAHGQGLGDPPRQGWQDQPAS